MLILQRARWKSYIDWNRFYYIKWWIMINYFNDTHALTSFQQGEHDRKILPHYAYRYNYYLPSYHNFRRIIKIIVLLNHLFLLHAYFLLRFLDFFATRVFHSRTHYLNIYITFRPWIERRSNDNLTLKFTLSTTARDTVTPLSGIILAIYWVESIIYSRNVPGLLVSQTPIILISC